MTITVLNSLNSLSVLELRDPAMDVVKVAAAGHCYIEWPS